MAPPSNVSTDSDAVATIDLGPHFEPIAFTPGRFAAAVQRSLQGTHAAQRLREHSTASFVLDLAADGGATACRGWRYRFTSDGPKVHTDDRFDDQQGYRGRHVARDGLIEVTLTGDDTVCPTVRASAFELRRTPTVTLRCVLAAPRDHAALTTPVLLCQWVDVATDEARAQLVPELAPDGWMLLGRGGGLRISVSGKPPGAHVGPDTQVEVAAAPAPVGPDAWQTPF